MSTSASLSLVQRHRLSESAVRLQREFSGHFGTETIERFLHDSLDRLVPDANYHDFVALLAERFARERLRSLAKMEGHVTTDHPTILFLCVHNAGRSQMASGFAMHHGGDAVDVLSGGSEPASEVNPVAIEAMREVGIDITSQFPTPWTDETLGAADVIVTMGCGDACPVVPGKRYLDWELTDPAGKGIEDVRPIRDDIEQRVRGLLVELDVPVRS